MTEIISVVFQKGGRAYYFDPKGKMLRTGDTVIVETKGGIEIGTVSQGNHMIEDDDVVAPLKAVIRVANDRDLKRQEENRQREKEALAVCEELVEHYRLGMKLLRAECSFDSNKILFYYTADGRVDFRALVKDLASRLHGRIELRQIGIRDATRLLGGIGICGQPYCCSRFLSDFHPVSIKMAKEQHLSLNPTNISGICGRLMCCLNFEQDAYEYLNSLTPNVNATVKTKDGIGIVTEANMITGNLFVKLLDSDAPPFKIHRDEVTLVSGNRRSNGKNKKESKE